MNFIKTIVNAVMTWVNKRLKENTPNWNQNDSNADGYIRNRPFYSEVKEVKVLAETTVTIDGEPVIVNYGPVIPFIEGQSYDVTWNGINYKCIAYLLSGIVVVGNDAIMGRAGTGEPFLIAIDKNMFGGAYIASSDIGTHTVSIEFNGEIVHKIDPKYMPSMDYVGYNEEQNLTDEQMEIARYNIGAGTSNFSGSYNDLTEQPIIYTDVVRYNFSQSLTDVQKTIARANIGAGTSDFNGDYNSLQNRIAYEDVTYEALLWSPANGDVSTPIANTSSGTVYYGTNTDDLSYINNGDIIVFESDKTIEYQSVYRKGKSSSSSSYINDFYVIGNESLLTAMNKEDIPYIAVDEYIIEDTGEDFCIVIKRGIASYKTWLISRTQNADYGMAYIVNKNLKQLDEKFIPDNIARTSDIPTIPVTSVNGQIGDVVIDIPSIEGLATKEYTNQVVAQKSQVQIITWEADD